MSKLRPFFLVFCCIALSNGLTNVGAFAQEKPKESDDAVLRELTTRFYYDFEKLDVEDQLAMWSPRSDDDSSKRDGTTKFFAILDKPKVEKLEIKKVVVDGENATVRLVVCVSALNKKNGKPLGGWLNHDVDLTHKLVKEAGRWRLMWQVDSFEGIADEVVAAKTDDERMRILSEEWDGKDPNLLSQLELRAITLAGRDHKYVESISMLKFTIKLAESIGDKRLEKEIEAFQAENYTMVGDHGLALLADQRHLELVEETNATDEVANAWNSIGGDYSALGDNQRALDAYQKAIAIRALTRRDESQMLTGNLAQTYLEIGDHEKARAGFQKLLDLSLKAKVDTPSAKTEAAENTARAYQGFADVDRAEGDLRGAREYYEKSHVLLTQNPRDKGALNNLLKNYAITDLELGNYDAAVAEASQAADIANEMNVPDLAWDAQLTEARAYRKLGKPEEAIKLLLQAIATIEAMRSRAIGDENTQAVFFRNKSSPYEELADIYIAAGDKQQALAYAEKGRARVLDRVMSGGRSRVEKILSAAEAEQETKLRNNISAANLELGRVSQEPKRDDSRLAAPRTQLDEARTQFEAFELTLYARHPELRSIRGDEQIAQIKDLATVLSNNSTAIVDFLMLSDKMIVFVARKGQGDSALINLSTVMVDGKDLADRVGKLKTKIANGDLDIQADERQLYDLLIKPINPQLVGATKLVIVPDGPLWNLPFQALMDEKGKYLAERMAISYAPSLTALREMQNKAKERKPSKDAELVAFGNPTVNRATAARVGQVFMDEKLEPLPEAERLVNTLAKMYGPRRSKVYTGAAAREETAKSEAPKYRIVQFATHGILNDVSPMYSHLVLAQNGNNPDEDGLLEAWELKDLDLKADMVILSACDTARGKISSGEGIIGMTWAAFIAGAPTTVASQWKVESTSTTELMLEFHRQLLTGMVSKAEALRRAQLKLMRNPKYRHPSYWAAWVIVGDAS